MSKKLKRAHKKLPVARIGRNSKPRDSARVLKGAENNRGVGWLFPPNELGQEYGFNDAGVQTFGGNFYQYLAREIIQNSLDARLSDKKPVIVEFNAITIKRSEIPGMGQLGKVCEQCSEYWHTEPGAVAFFDRGAKLAGASSIEALRIRESNTTGVIGDDNDREQNKNWYSLVRSSGSSSKHGGEGGSFGLGKNAPFAASNLHTVLYSTNTGKGRVAFQGVARLATHFGAEGEKCQNVGYLGGPKGQSIRTASKIPELFRRTDVGTDLVILGYITEPTWEEQLRFSVLENFWPAIHFGTLEVRIGAQTISKKNLADLLAGSASEKDFTAHQYYETFVTPTKRFDASLPYLGDVSVYLRSGEVELPNRVAMVRKSGMVIHLRPFRSAMRYCGVFMCLNEEGNAHLRQGQRAFCEG